MQRVDTLRVSTSPVRLVSYILAGIAGFSLLRSMWEGQSIFYLWSLVALCVSASSLYATTFFTGIKGSSFRLGFHLGTYVFYLSYSVFSADRIAVFSANSASVDTHHIIGIAFTLSIIGFEVGYRFKNKKESNEKDSLYYIADKSKVFLTTLVIIGVVCWLMKMWVNANTVGLTITSLLLSMRGVVIDKSSQANEWKYADAFLNLGVFLAAYSASLILTYNKVSNLVLKLFCWSTLILIILVGLLNGSRSYFLYTVVPLLSMVWRKFAGRAILTSKKIILLVIFSISGVGAFWLISTFRDSGLENIFVAREDVQLNQQLEGAFANYWVMIDVVETFPDALPYEYGKSLIPTILGWVPRTLWPEKPYPFGLFLNVIRGESLEERAASLAVGVTGEGYGNGGLFGVLIWGWIFGICCRNGDQYIANLSIEHPFGLDISLVGFIWVAMMVRGGVPEMFQMGAFVIIFPIFLSKLFLRKLSL